jgi:dipeptidyl aminopeptidase/acylaminoacyl peptidase
MANPDYFYANSRIATVPSSGGAPTVLSASFDEDPNLVAWKSSGIYFAASQHTWSYLHRLDPETKTITRLAPRDAVVMSSFSLSRDGSTVAFLGSDPKSLAEVFVAPVTSLTTARKLTDTTA